MELPFTQHIKEGKIVRTFTLDVDSDELKWHKDLNDRRVNIIESGGWQYQTENNLPNKLKNGDKLWIPKLAWHRVIKGTENLIIEIEEF